MLSYARVLSQAESSICACASSKRSLLCFSLVHFVTLAIISSFRCCNIYMKFLGTFSCYCSILLALLLFFVMIGHIHEANGVLRLPVPSGASLRSAGFVHSSYENKFLSL
jgi:hypothetical protein